MPVLNGRERTYSQLCTTLILSSFEVVSSPRFLPFCCPHSVRDIEIRPHTNENTLVREISVDNRSETDLASLALCSLAFSLSLSLLFQFKFSSAKSILE